MDKASIDAAIKAMEDWYHEHGMGRETAYTFGYMDALAVLRGLRGTN